MPIKEQAIELIRTLPDDCTLEDIQYHLYVRAKVENGIKRRSSLFNTDRIACSQ